MKNIKIGILILLLVSAVLSVEAEVFSFTKADLTVAADGSGDVKTVGEAIAKVPENNKKRFTIFIKKGVYDEQINIPATKPYISLIGENAESTKLTFKISNKDAGSTSAAFAFYVAGHDFYAENLTFENSFGLGSQAVAVVSDADRAIFKKSRFLGWQDTLYTRRGRQYFTDCYIEGSVDFIFGQAAAVFENCLLHSKTDGYIAAPMRFAANEPSGLIFIKSKLTAENTVKSVYLGRPWRDYGRAVFLETEMDAHIRAEGWHHWQPEREKTAYFAEYKSKGQGAKTETRVKWSHQLNEQDAKQFYAENFLKGADGWNPKSGNSNGEGKVAEVFRPVKWSPDILKREPIWYPTDEAVTIALQLLIHQKENGGWEKNRDNAALLTLKQRDSILKKKSVISETTIDNRTTYTQIAYLAKVITGLTNSNPKRAEIPVLKESFNKGLDYLLAAQYENGGFPQFFPLKKGYYTHITFNDDAMIGVLKVLREIAKKNDDYLFVDEERRAKAEKAVEKAMPVLFKTQVLINGKKTVWVQQYDEFSLKPAAARAFEPISLTSGESVGIVRFLMLDANPNQEKIDAIESAIAWFRANKIEGIRWTNKNGEFSVVKDKNAPPIWARFYEIDTMKPIFIGRDSVIKYDVSEIEAERRNGYAWYISEPNELLEKDYPKWKEKIEKARSNK